MSLGSSLPRSLPHHGPPIAPPGAVGRNLAPEYTNYMMAPSSQHHNKNPSPHLMGLINGNGNGPNTDHYGPIVTKSANLSDPWHPHPPSSLLQPPPLVPHHMQSDHRHHHSSSTLHSQQHHDNIVSLNEVNEGCMPEGAPDLNDESATSDLATSFFGYRYQINSTLRYTLGLMGVLKHHINNNTFRIFQ